MKTMLTFITCAVTGFIFAQSTAPLDVKVLSESGKPYVGDKIYFVGQTSKASFSGVTNAAGKFHIELPQGDVYDIKIMSIGDELEYNTLEIPVLKEGEMFEMMELEIMYEAAKNYTLDNLQFDTGKSTIKTVSFPILDNIAELMLLKPTMKIEIAGHTDSDGDDAAIMTRQHRLGRHGRIGEKAESQAMRGVFGTSLERQAEAEQGIEQPLLGALDDLPAGKVQGVGNGGNGFVVPAGGAVEVAARHGADQPVAGAMMGVLAEDIGIVGEGRR